MIKFNKKPSTFTTYYKRTNMRKFACRPLYPSNGDRIIYKLNRRRTGCKTKYPLRHVFNRIVLFFVFVMTIEFKTRNIMCTTKLITFSSLGAKTLGNRPLPTTIAIRERRVKWRQWRVSGGTNFHPWSSFFFDRDFNKSVGFNSPEINSQLAITEMKTRNKNRTPT